MYRIHIWKRGPICSKIPGVYTGLSLYQKLFNFNFNFILPKVNTDYMRQAQVLNIDNLKLIIYLCKFNEKHKITQLNHQLKSIKRVQSTCKCRYSWASLISVGSSFQSRIARGKNEVMWCFVFEWGMRNLLFRVVVRWLWSTLTCLLCILFNNLFNQGILKYLS